MSRSQPLRLSLILCMSLLMGATPGTARYRTAITFSDPDIEAAVRNALNQPTGPLDADRVATIETLQLPGKRIQSLRGIEVLTGLQTLDLSENFYEPRPECGTGWSPTLDNVDLTP